MERREEGREVGGWGERERLFVHEQRGKEKWTDKTVEIMLSNE